MEEKTERWRVATHIKSGSVFIGNDPEIFLKNYPDVEKYSRKDYDSIPPELIKARLFGKRIELTTPVSIWYGIYERD